MAGMANAPYRTLVTRKAIHSRSADAKGSAAPRASADPAYPVANP